MKVIKLISVLVCMFSFLGIQYVKGDTELEKLKKKYLERSDRLLTQKDTGYYGCALKGADAYEFRYTGPNKPDVLKTPIVSKTPDIDIEGYCANEAHNLKGLAELVEFLLKAKADLNELDQIVKVLKGSELEPKETYRLFQYYLAKSKLFLAKISYKPDEIMIRLFPQIVYFERFLGEVAKIHVAMRAEVARVNAPKKGWMASLASLVVSDPKPKNGYHLYLHTHLIKVYETAAKGLKKAHEKLEELDKEEGFFAKPENVVKHCFGTYVDEGIFTPFAIYKFIDQRLDACYQEDDSLDKAFAIKVQ